MRFIEVRRTDDGWAIRIEGGDPSQLWMPLSDAERAEVRRMVKEECAAAPVTELSNGLEVSGKSLPLGTGSPAAPTAERPAGTEAK